MNGINIEINQNSIAKRAYEIHLSKTDSNGDALSDWLKAEAELKNELMQELNKDIALTQKKVEKKQKIARTLRSGKTGRAK
ncbi:MAG: DUF2934 domain-containing protein [Bdellovibrio sp.]|nr:DUF2934 domain-containing protein [Bdellovibrio sp.]